MDGISQFAVTFARTVLKLAFIELVSINVVSIFGESVVLNLANVDVLRCQLLFISRELNFFAFIIFGPSFSEADLPLVPIIQNELFFVRH